MTVLDAAHNPQAGARAGRQYLSLGFASNATRCLDAGYKDADSVIEVMREHVDTVLPPLDSPRALSPAALAVNRPRRAMCVYATASSMPGGKLRRWPAKMIELRSARSTRAATRPAPPVAQPQPIRSQDH